MKYLSLALFFTGCTMIPTQHGTAQFWGDYNDVDFSDGTVHLSASRMVHSNSVRANWNGIGGVAGTAAATAIGLKSGQQVIGATAAVLPAVVNRPTNRATPVPTR